MLPDRTLDFYSHKLLMRTAELLSNNSANGMMRQREFRKQGEKNQVLESTSVFEDTPKSGGGGLMKRWSGSDAGVFSSGEVHEKMGGGADADIIDFEDVGTVLRTDKK